MREHLAPLLFRRHRFTALVAGRGTVRTWGQPGGPPTLLLRDVRDEESGEVMCGHCWAPLPLRLAVPPVGARIAFRATVRPYRRGSGEEDCYLTGLRHVRCCAGEKGS